MRNRLVDRLVDKAEVLERYGELYEIFDDSREIQKEIDKIYDKINDLPYVDVEAKAIPIEWINDWLNKGRNAKYFIPMMEMIKEWEEESKD